MLIVNYRGEKQSIMRRDDYRPILMITYCENVYLHIIYGIKILGCASSTYIDRILISQKKFLDL